MVKKRVPRRLKPVIHTIQIKNFKSFRDTGKLSLRPLTLLVGPNSSGKTSLFQSLLALKQTLESGNFEVPLVLKGKYADLSSYRNLVFNHHQRRQLSIMIDFESHRLRRHPVVRAKTTFGPAKIEGKVAIRKTEYLGPNQTTLTVTPGSLNVNDQKSHVAFGFESKNDQSNFLIVPRVPSVYTDQEYIGSIQLRKTEFSKLAAATKRGKGTKTEPNDAKRSRELKRYEAYVEYLQSLQRRITKGLVAKTWQEAVTRSHILDSSVSQAHTISLDTRTLFESVHYIGPLRDYPQRYYFSSGEYPDDVGLRGERLAEIINYNFADRPKSMAKLNRWIEEMELGEKLIFSNIEGEENLFTIQIKSNKSGLVVNIRDIGFGASQLLPILVQGATLQPRSVLLIEQPEIHLHPALQAKLADFLISTVQDNKQVIVETHSEHLLLRLQTRIAQGRIHPDDVAILSFEPSERGTRITSHVLSPSGTMKNWPKGFFEEDIKESLDLLRAIGEDDHGNSA